MSVFNENEQRKVFLEVVKENILGPGAYKDIYLCSEDLSDELINMNPVEQYYSGMIFPWTEEQCNIERQDEDEQAEIADVGEDVQNLRENEDDAENENGQNNLGSQSDPAWRTRYYPNNIGLIFCISEDANQVKVKFTYSKYSRLTEKSEIKVKLGETRENYTLNKERLQNILQGIHQQNSYEVFEQGVVEQLHEVVHFSDEERSIYLSARPRKNELNSEGETIQSPISRADIALLYKKFREEAGEQEYSHSEYVMSKLPFLFEDNYFKRQEISTEWINIDVSEDISGREKRRIENNNDITYRCKVFTRTRNGVTKKFVKLLLENNLPWDVPGENGSSNRGWKLRTLFQPEIMVESDHFTDYKDLLINAVDEENAKTEYLYREEKSFGKGIKCAIEWDESTVVKWVKSSYMPEAYIRDFSNDVSDRLEGTQEILKLKNISHWTEFSDNELVTELERFVDKFEVWHHDQLEEASSEPAFEDVYNDILGKQNELLLRLKDNISYLKENEEALKCFKFANTAMYLQMIIARSPGFSKNREYNEVEGTHFNDIDYFKNIDFANRNDVPEPKYRPFQLAFLLMNVKPTFEQEDPYRNNVDLIWFPTGGGKTEAYLALTALTIIARRRTNDEVRARGVSVIMRYTLRLLTAQQFERATYLICALEFLRNKCQDIQVGHEKISIGMWVGGSTTPNRTNELQPGANNKFSRFISDTNANGALNKLQQLQNKNPFPISYCPWCGCKLLTADQGILSGYSTTGSVKCMNNNCHFNIEGLPVYYIDDIIYQKQPTLLFGTVDKFANLTKDEGHRLFNSKPSDEGLTPDLIIQDELHLISGPLGSMVGLFESLIEQMASKDGRKPKIIASTATTRNTKYLVKQLYNRDVTIFPAQGIKYSDNFFSRANLDSRKRLHVGVIPVGHTAAMTEIRMVAMLIIARIKLFKKYLNHIDIDDTASLQEHFDNLTTPEGKLKKDLDDYWTPVLYYNSLKDLGRTKSRIPQEIYEAIRAMINLIDYPDSMKFIIENFYNRVSEFTSREDSSKIKSLLTKAESEIELMNDDERISVADGMDLIMASNMISVGIDIGRLNVMLFAGQPRSVSEYIQSSSRVARGKNGIVFNLLNANRVRELSLFENFTAFHKVYYMYVEPLSATPYTEATVDRLLANILVSYIRHIEGVSAREIEDCDISPLIQFLANRCADERQENYIRNRLTELKQKWVDLVDRGSIVNYNYFNANEDADFQLLKSLRSIDPDCFTKIESVRY